MSSPRIRFRLRNSSNNREHLRKLREGLVDGIDRRRSLEEELIKAEVNGCCGIFFVGIYDTELHFRWWPSTKSANKKCSVHGDVRKNPPFLKSSELKKIFERGTS